MDVVSGRRRQRVGHCAAGKRPSNRPEPEQHRCPPATLGCRPGQPTCHAVQSRSTAHRRSWAHMDGGLRRDRRGGRYVRERQARLSRFRLERRRRCSVIPVRSAFQGRAVWPVSGRRRHMNCGMGTAGLANKPTVSEVILFADGRPCGACPLKDFSDLIAPERLYALLPDNTLENRYRGERNGRASGSSGDRALTACGSMARCGARITGRRREIPAVSGP